jgi:hypothetical protein
MEKVLKSVEKLRGEMVEALSQMCRIPAIAPESGGEGEASDGHGLFTIATGARVAQSGAGHARDGGEQPRDTVPIEHVARHGAARALVALGTAYVKIAEHLEEREERRAKTGRRS